MNRKEVLRRFQSGEDLDDLVPGAPGPDLARPDGPEPMVSRSLRLPLDLDERIRAVAESRGIGATTLMREWIEKGLAELDQGATVPLADVIRVLASLSQKPPRAA
jgi:predicted transcriptional regulator